MPTTIGDASLKSLAAFMPPAAQSLFAQRVDELIDLIDKERHMEGERLFERLLEGLDTAAEDCRREGGIPAVVTAPAASDPPPRAPSVLATHVLRDYLKGSVEYALCKRKADGTRNLVDFVNDSQGWNVGSVDTMGNGTFYRAEPDLGGSYSFKTVGIVDVPILSLASVLIEVSLFHTWFPMCCASEEAGAPHRLHKFGRFVIKAPWPVAYRDVFIEGYAVDDMTHNRRVVIVGQSVEREDQCPPGVKYLPVEGNHVRATVHRQGFILEPRGDKTRISFVTNTNPHIRNIPMMLVNYISGKIVWVLLGQMAKAAKGTMDPASEHAQLMTKSPWIYKYMEYRLSCILDQWAVVDAEADQRQALLAEQVKAWETLRR